MLQYSTYINGYDILNLTKLDVLDGLDEIKVAVKYKIGDKVLEGFPGTFHWLSIYNPLFSRFFWRLTSYLVYSRPRSVISGNSRVYHTSWMEGGHY